MSLKSLAQKIDLSIAISDKEKKQAAYCVKLLEKLVGKNLFFNRYLNLMYNPFKKYENVSTESVLKHRGSIWRYAQQIQDQFKEIQELVKTINKSFAIFKTDAKISSLLDALSDEMESDESATKKVYDKLIDWDSASFKKNIIDVIDKLKKSLKSTRELVENRFIEHIKKNILSRSWLDGDDGDSDGELQAAAMIEKHNDKFVKLYAQRYAMLKERGYKC